MSNVYKIPARKSLQNRIFAR